MKFFSTKPHLRFTEFAEACQQYRYIGVCYGAAGVGKTMSARQYSGWKFLKEHYDQSRPMTAVAKRKLAKCTSVFCTAKIINTPKRLWSELFNKIQLMGKVVLQAKGEKNVAQIALKAAESCPLVIIDEVDRLTMNTIEQLRDMYDTYNFGLILIGMPGIEKKLMRYPQLYSRIGFAHEFTPLATEDLLMVIKYLCKYLCIELDGDSNKYNQATSTIGRITQGNFRLTERLLTQVKPIQQVNQIQYIDHQVVEAARNLLVVGTN